jgi:hypothetical protein
MTESARFQPPSRAQLLADLRWLLLSSPLLAPELYPLQVQAFEASLLLHIQDWLDTLERDQPELKADDFDMQSYQRLGRYAEKLLRYFLLQFPRAGGGKGSTHFKLIAHNLAIRTKVNDESSSEIRTLGEIDFLLEDADQIAWHWEVAVKFFACEPQARRTHQDLVSAHEIYGPNRKDQLSLKIAKLFDRQLRHDAPAPFNRSVWRPQAFVRGRIYYRLDESRPQSHTQTGTPVLNFHHEQGLWCHPSDLPALLERHPAQCIYPLQRSEWMSAKTPTTLDQARERFDPRNASSMRRFSEFGLPLMIALLSEDREIARAFVLPAMTE